MIRSLNSLRLGLLACGALAFVTVNVAQATPVPAINYDGTLASGRSDFTGTVGNLFTVGAQSLTVEALGAQDFGSTGANTDGFVASPISVGIWDATGTTLLASTTVASSDPLTGSYRYAAITPIVLTAGTSYLIGALVGGGIELFGDGHPSSPYTGNGIITIAGDRFSSNVSLAAPTSDGGGADGRWGPANFLATVVPEPSSLSMLLFGSVLLWALRRKRG